MHDKIKIHCCNCNSDTWQQILFEKLYQSSSDEKYDHCSKCIVTECCGCEQPHYRCSSWMQNKDGTEKDMEDEWVFPPKQLRAKPWQGMGKEWGKEWGQIFILDKWLGEGPLRNGVKS